VDKVLEFCDFNSAATWFYTQQLIPSAAFAARCGDPAGKRVVGQFDKGFIADAMNVCLKARNSQANC
jgi:hypothetical protein